MTALPPIDELVPHARPMILVDRLIRWEPGHATCEVVLGPDAPMVQDGRVRALVAIEYMAQSVAAYAGMKERERGEKPSIGLLLGSRELRLEVPYFTVGDRLTVEVEHVFGDERLGSFRCRVLRGSDKVAEALLNVYQAGPELTLP